MKKKTLDQLSEIWQVHKNMNNNNSREVKKWGSIRVTISLVLCVCFVDRCLSFCPFPFGHCVGG